VGAPGKIAGRMLVDPSNPSEGHHPLNCPEVKTIGKDLWPLQLPTIEDILVALVQHARASGHPISEYRICKEDVSNAFGCNKIAPEDAALFCTRLTETLVMMHYYNNFGHIIGPHIFGPLSRCMTEAVQALVSGIVKTYIDDFNAFFTS